MSSQFLISEGESADTLIVTGSRVAGGFLRVEIPGKREDESKREACCAIGLSGNLEWPCPSCRSSWGFPWLESASQSGVARQSRRRPATTSFVTKTAKVKGVPLLSSPFCPQARSLLCYWAVRELGMAMSELSVKLGLSLAGVSQAVRRGETIAEEAGYSLTRD